MRPPAPLLGCALLWLTSCATAPEAPPPSSYPPAPRAPLERAQFCVEPVAQPIELWMERAAELGVGTVGVNQVEWGLFEPQAPLGGTPRYDTALWSALDRVVDHAEAAGQRLQLTVQVRSSWGTASTAGGVGAPGSSPVRGTAQEAYQRWLGDLIERASTEAGLIVMIGNELEAPGHWNGAPGLPADGPAYSDLFELSALVRDDFAPTAPLWRASTNFGPLFDDGPDETELEERLELVLSDTGWSLLEEAWAGALRADAFSLHPNYAPEGLWHQAQWVRDRLPENIPLVAEDMRSVPVEGLPGTGWPDEDGDGRGDIFDQIAAGEAEAIARWQAAQVDTLSQKLLTAIAADLSVFCVSTLFDFPLAYPLEAWHHTGLVDEEGTRRPGFEAYRLWIDTLVGWTAEAPLSTGPRWVVPFSRGAERALAVWGTGDWSPAEGDAIAEILEPPRTAGQRDWTLLPVTQTLSLGSTPLWVRLE